MRGRASSGSADIDWRAGELIVRGKQDRHERLPLPADVGEALVDYLRHGRPSCEDPHVFVKARAPFGALTGGAGAIGMLVRAACERAGLAPVGAHRLRHTVATEALRAGAPLEEIASLLRHRRHATTVVYAKVDWERLRELARPWPGRRVMTGLRDAVADYLTIRRALGYKLRGAPAAA